MGEPTVTSGPLGLLPGHRSTPFNAFGAATGRMLIAWLTWRQTLGRHLRRGSACHGIKRFINRTHWHDRTR
jgi:hypothetical protein